ncbi:NADH:flavin oxidoreductase / NADH oxidase family domain-containing protein [Cordyceps javanica]|uniref:NADH:flavin oxidoreductase / NADH oxidase family domain-containing protein n=1 Tax=Cordyceps javanica TaxID=43265 RepID=A0A545UUU8_9HYPO|nr:NADH:flavin oxidoreductase / NADH oxidase family domain-containing protein [Cordyceps javanica]TQW05400.1 NADH:flavin oxidoreductase / NADH oxidase family domain-containing protein [Cordyceps javanica]
MSPLSHRVITSSLIRFRADGNHVAMPLMKENYLQRACTPGTIIIAESCAVSHDRGGISYGSAVFGEEKVAAWRDIRLWPSRIAGRGRFTVKGRPQRRRGAPSRANAAVPEETTLRDIQHTADSSAQAARNARRAGFDGIEIY